MTKLARAKRRTMRHLAGFRIVTEDLIEDPVCQAIDEALVDQNIYEYLASFEELSLLKPIRDDLHLHRALGVIDRLLATGWDARSQSYLELLTDLVEAYEDVHYPMPGDREGES